MSDLELFGTVVAAVAGLLKEVFGFACWQLIHHVSLLLAVSTHVGWLQPSREAVDVPKDGERPVFRVSRNVGNDLPPQLRHHP